MSEARTSADREAVRFWAGREAANRWKSLIALGLLAGLSGGFAVSAVAGARRTGTAYERFRAATGRSNAIVFATQLGIFNADYSAVDALPEVSDAGEFTLAPLGIEQYPSLGALAPNDEHLYRTLDRPLLAAGRLPDPRRADEIMVNRSAAALFHLHIGQRVTLVSSTDINAFFGTAPLTGGPTTSATIVGVGDSNMDLIFGVDKPSFTPSADSWPHTRTSLVPEISSSDSDRARTARPSASTWLRRCTCPTSPSGMNPRMPSVRPTGRISNGPPCCCSPAVPPSPAC